MDMAKNMMDTTQNSLKYGEGEEISPPQTANFLLFEVP